MVCNRCKSAADHPSNYNLKAKATLGHCTSPTCSCKHRSHAKALVESLYDPETVDLEWVRTRRFINYSKPGTVQ